MLQNILLVVMILISLSLTGLVLLQKSEGGALGMGGGPSGFMTARGAGNLLTKATWGLALAGVLCAIGLTIVGNMSRGNRSVIDAEAVGALVTPTAPPAGTEAAPVQIDPAALAPAVEAPTGSLSDLEAEISGAAPAAAQPAPAE